MKKLLLFSTLLFFFNFSYAQTVEIKQIDLQQLFGPFYSVTSSETDLTGDTYDIQKVYFDYDEIDTDTYHHILFTFHLDDGVYQYSLGNVTYEFAESTKQILGLANIPLYFTLNPGTYTLTVEATGIDSDNAIQTIIESDAWTITITTPPTQIFDNTLCCDQTTFKYPFDPVAINQASNTTVSTEDNAPITSVQWQKLTGTTWTNITGATQYSYDPPSVTADTKYRRVLTSSSGAVPIDLFLSI